LPRGAQIGRVDPGAELKRFILQLGASVDVLAPDFLRREIAAEHAAAVKRGPQSGLAVIFGLSRRRNIDSYMIRLVDQPKLMNKRVRRQLVRSVLDAMRTYPAVVLTGPRQSGKTTLARHLLPTMPYCSLEEPDEEEHALRDPRGFLARFPDGAILDEVQRCPDLFRYLQSILDREKRLGLFLLTGSQQFQLLERITQSLAGRVAMLELLPFTLAELQDAGREPATLEDLLCRGLYPPVHDRPVDPRRWYLNYVRTYVERDVRRVVNIRDLVTFDRFFQACAARTGQLVNVASLAADCGIDQRTAQQWLALLEASYVIFRLPANERTFRKRPVRTPKLYVIDPGLAAAVVGVRDAGDLQTHPARGALFETWVVTEFVKARYNAALPSNLSFWRDRAGNEIDLLVDDGRRQIPVEVKAGKTLSPDWLTALRARLDRSHERVGSPVLIYGGEISGERSGVRVTSWRRIREVTEGDDTTKPWLVREGGGSYGRIERMRADPDYAGFFRALTGVEPYPYQRRFAEGRWPEIVDVATGLGKTAAVVIAWLYRRLRRDPETPRRLVYCLPMRVLVEQTARSAEVWIEAGRQFFEDAGLEPPRVYLQMGGVRDDEWTERPESPAIVVGTQDLLLSAALLRGYGVPRSRWPVPFAFLHADALWVFDEVQLMGPGRATSAQLEGLRRSLGVSRRGKSLWLSATLDERWLSTADFAEHLKGATRLSLAGDDRSHPEVKKRLDAPKALARAHARLDVESAKRDAASYAGDLAAEVLEAHRPGTRTLVFVNSVARAQALYLELERRSLAPDLALVHARFRAEDRAAAEQRLLAPPSEAGTIAVATQALEAGIDVSAATLFTEIAPWPSLVQRFGRANRYGEIDGATVRWIDIASEEKLPLPYEAAEFDEARQRLSALTSASPSALPPARSEPQPGLVLRRRDLLDLFDTNSDLSGFDIDVSPYVRDAGDLDVAVFWRDLSGATADDEPAPERHEICRVSLSDIEAYAKRIRTEDGKIRCRDPLDGRWMPLDRRTRPGETLLLDASLGGYDPRLGFVASLRTRVTPVPAPEAQPAEDYGADWRSRQVHPVALERHLLNVEDEARALCDALDAGAERTAIERAARWHDVGKAHPIFQKTLKSCTAVAGIAGALAKSPCSGRHERPRFRHELASMLAWLDQHDGEEDADLVAYLIAAHHGKVRLGVRSLPGEAHPDDPGKRFARGVWDGDHLPGLRIGDREIVRDATLRLDIAELGGGASARSWAERTQALLDRYGPFHLAWLEALVRIADWRASAREQHLGDQGDPLGVERQVDAA
jgi:CRISPR-associated endonuclease/helicase Cas3